MSDSSPHAPTVASPRPQAPAHNRLRILLLCFVVLAVGHFVVLTQFVPFAQKSPKAACLSNLNAIVYAAHAYASREGATAISLAQLAKEGHLKPADLICPSNSPAPPGGCDYALLTYENPGGGPVTTLSPDCLVAFESNPPQHSGIAAVFADGRRAILSVPQMRASLRTSLATAKTNNLLSPDEQELLNAALQRYEAVEAPNAAP